MRVYMYAAALLCEKHGLEIREDKRLAGRAPKDPADESSYDSDDYPKGPYENGGGEADTPQHCDACGVFLQNPLTSDGVQYVAEHILDSRRDNKTVQAWADFYKYELRNYWKENPVFYRPCEICGGMHPITFGGDCRDKENRFTTEELDERHGADGWQYLPADTEKMVSALRVGDLVDLEGDKFADPDGKGVDYQFEYAEVYSIESESPTCIAVGFVSGPVVGFPPDHLVKVAQ